jgi:hypothetical protein
MEAFGKERGRSEISDSLFSYTTTHSKEFHRGEPVVNWH